MEDPPLVDIFEGKAELGKPLHDCLLREVFSLLSHLFYVIGQVTHYAHDKIL